MEHDVHQPDRDTRLDWLVAHGNDQEAWFEPPKRFIGLQSVGLYQAIAPTQFRDVSAAANLQRRGRWRTLAVEDWDDDGDADLAVGGQHELPRLYRNDIENGNHGVVLRLRGTSSDRLGVEHVAHRVDRRGVRAPAAAAWAAWRRLSVQAPFVSVGLGRATRVARLRVTWPSGAVQELRDLAADRSHTIVEPSAFTVTPATRSAPADGASVITVLVTPATSAAPCARHARRAVAHGPRRPRWRRHARRRRVDGARAGARGAGFCGW